MQTCEGLPLDFTGWGLLLQGYFFSNSKHGVNSIVPIHQDPKPGKVTFFECGGLGVEQWVGVEAKTKWQLKSHSSPHAGVFEFFQGE